MIKPLWCSCFYFSCMRKLPLITILPVSFQSKINTQTVLEINGSQRIVITGYGPGQDATINPFQGVECYAVIENLVEALYSVRIQEKEQIIEIIDD